MEQQKNEWIESTLQALNDMQRAPMPDTLHRRILSSIPVRGRKLIALQQRTIMLAAAGLALLIGFNVYSLTVHNKAEHAMNSTIAMHGENPLADEYFPPAPSI